MPFTNKEDGHVTSLPLFDTEAGQSSVPNGWRYKRLKVGSWEGTYYASPLTQIILVSSICFLCPGMSSALSGLGGAGQLDPTVANNATVAIYSTLAVFAFFGGSMCNLLGVRWSLTVGGFGYAVAVSSYICYNHTGNQDFVIFGGALCGLCASLLWTGQGTIVMSYPPENKKGKYISLGWAIYNTGAVLGALIPLGETLNGSGSSVGDGTYIAFTSLMLLGSAMGFLLINPDKVIREDGSRVTMTKHKSWKSQFLDLWRVLQKEYWISLLFPMFFCSNWAYTYQFNDFNLARFNTRTRSLNNVVYWMMQIIGSCSFGVALDWEHISRPMRARAAWVILLAITLALWGAALKYQIGFTRADVPATAGERMDWTDAAYGPLFAIYIFRGFYDAAWQTTVYWYMGALSNNSQKLAIYTGFYKSIQSSGTAVVYRLDSLLTPYTTMFGAAWGLLLGGLVFAFPVVWFRVTDHTLLANDLDFSDERIEDTGHSTTSEPTV